MTNGTTENWLSGNEKQLDNSPLASVSKPPIEEVDRLADELADEYDNHKYRAWYCRIIYKYGLEQVRYWQDKARSGDFPGKLFGYYVHQAEARHNTLAKPESSPTQSSSGLDEVYEPTDADMTPEGIKRLFGEINEDEL